MEVTGTKWKIFKAAIVLFAQKGYHAVSMRDIAQVTGIKAASIYNHFASKDDLLCSIFDYYSYNASLELPDLSALLKMAATCEPSELFESLETHFSEEMQPIMDKIILIAGSLMRSDPRAADLVYSFATRLDSYVIPVLNELVKENRIAPLDVEAFALLYSSFCFSTAMHMDSAHPVGTELRQRGLHTLFDCVRVIEVSQC